MSAPAINPAPSPTPGAGAAVGAAAGGQGGQGAQANGAVAGFEAVLATLFGTEVATGAETTSPATSPGTGTKAGGKVTVGVKAGLDDTKTKGKTADVGKIAANDATSTTATPDPNLLTVVAAANLPTAGTQIPVVGTPAVEGAAGEHVTNGSPGKTAIPKGVATLAQLTGAAIDPNAGPTNKGDKVDPAATPVLHGSVAVSAGQAATNVTANVTFDAPTAPKGEGAPQVAPKVGLQEAPQTPQTPTPFTSPTATSQTILPTTQAPANSPAPQAVIVDTVTAAVATPMVAIEAVAGQPAAPPAGPVGAKEVGGKDKVQAPKGITRVDVSQVNTPPGSAGVLAAKVSDAPQSLSDAPYKGLIEDAAAHEPAIGAQDGASEPTQTPTDPTVTSCTMTSATLVQAAAVAVRGSPQTVANLAAQIVKKLDSRSSQFDVQLDPAGLGKVDVRIAIGADGRISAAMSFDNPQAAAELKSRAGELHQAMEQAGFDLTGGMSFDVASDSGQGGQAQNQQPETGAAFRGRAFQAVLGATADASPPPQLPLRRNSPSGVDIRI